MAKNNKQVLSDNLVLATSELPQNKTYSFDISFTAEQLTQAANELDISDITKLSFKGGIRASGENGFVLEGDIGATVVQDCVVSLEPVKTRIDEKISRHFLADYKEPDADSVIEMDENVEFEPLLAEIDLGAIAREAVALNIPLYPRAPDAALETTVFSAPGIKPMTDEDTKPFAGLAALKDKLEG